MPPPPPPPKNDITIANDVQLGNPIPVTNPSKAASKGSKKPTVNLDAGGKNGGRNEEQQAKLKKAVRNASAAKGKGKESLNVNQVSAYSAQSNSIRGIPQLKADLLYSRTHF